MGAMPCLPTPKKYFICDDEMPIIGYDLHYKGGINSAKTLDKVTLSF